MGIIDSLFNSKTEKKALILGNGVSRLDHKKFIESWKDEIWVCNEAFEEFKNYSRAGTVHPKDLLKKMIQYRKDNNLNFDIYINYPKFKTNDPFVHLFTEYRGWATGSQMLLQAMIEGYKVWLLGYDMGGLEIGSNIDITYNANKFKSQFLEITDQFGTSNIKFVGENHLEKIDEWKKELKWKQQ